MIHLCLLWKLESQLFFLIRCNLGTEAQFQLILHQLNSNHSELLRLLPFEGSGAQQTGVNEKVNKTSGAQMSSA